MAFDTSGFTSETQDKFNQLVAAAKARGIDLNYNSGSRTYEDQQQLYANWQAGRAGKPLPYPDRGAVAMAAKPGTSPHEFGVAFDVSAKDSNRQAELNALGQGIGLKTIAGDPGHFQLADWKGGKTVPDAVASQGHYEILPDEAHSPYWVPDKPIGTRINAPNAPVQGALASQPTGMPSDNPLLSHLIKFESGGKNVTNVDATTSSGRARGLLQITDGTWREFGAPLGIDFDKYPTAQSAPPEVQWQVGSTIPLSRWDPKTLNYLSQNGIQFDKTKTLGENVAATGGGTTTATAAVAPANQSWFGKLTTPPVDPATGQPKVGAQSPLQNLVQAYEKGPERMKAAEEEQAPEQVKNETGPAPPARNVSPGLANIQQTYGQTLNSFSQPLTWTNAPPQAPNLPAAGLQTAQATQTPGISLNSFQPPFQGLGYGINPVGYGYG